MPQLATSTLLRCIRTMASKPNLSGLSDQELLRQFVSQSDENAFTELVRRHGPMVLDAAWSVIQPPRRRGCLPGYLPRALTKGRLDPQAKLVGQLALRCRIPSCFESSDQCRST